jgi:hypothetical protein
MLERVTAQSEASQGYIMKGEIRMANALKCDRCGNYFDYEPNVKNFIAFGHKDIVVGKNRPVKDICPDCMVQFMNWFENPVNWKPEDCLMYIGNDDERVNNLYKEAEEISNNAGDIKEPKLSDPYEEGGL